MIHKTTRFLATVYANKEHGESMIQKPRIQKIGGLRRAFGLTLIEVLIALLVLSIGLVGLSSVHLLSLKAAHSSYYRSLAATAALDAEELAWSLLAKNLDSADPYATGKVCVDEFITDFTGAIENQIETKWRASGGLPSSLGINVTLLSPAPVNRADSDNNGTWADQWRDLDVEFTWLETRFEAASNQESFVHTIRLPCVSTYSSN